MKRVHRIIIIVILIGVLAAIRSFSPQLFYDPLINFYKQDYLNSLLPELNFSLLMLNVFLRYLINSVVSLIIIYVVFQKRETVFFSSWIYFGCFFVFIIPFYFFLIYYEQENYLLLFYVRRFLIQPILLLLLIPAFYYQKLTDN